MEIHFQGFLPVEHIQRDGHSNQIDLHLHLSSSQKRVNSIGEDVLDEVVSNSTFEGSLSQYSHSPSAMNHEKSYQRVKHSNQLVVDFFTFHKNVLELVQKCLNEGRRSSNPTFRMQLIENEDDTGTIKFIEITSFRQTTYLSLTLRKGSDREIKKHLSCELKTYKDRSFANENEVKSLRSELKNICEKSKEQILELTNENTYMRENQEKELNRLKMDFHTQMTELKERNLKNEQRMMRENEEEKKDSVMELKEKLESKEKKNEELMEENVLLNDIKSKIQTKNEMLEGRLRIIREEKEQIEEDLKKMKLRTRESEHKVIEYEKQIKSETLQIVAFEQQLKDKSEHIEQLKMLNEAIQEKDGKQKEETTVYRKKSKILAKQLKEVIQEVNKAQKIIDKLCRDKRKVVKHTKRITKMNKQKEYILREKEKENDSLKSKCSNFEDQISRLEMDLSSERKKNEKLIGDKKVVNNELEANREMIEQLSNQLNEIQFSHPNMNTSTSSNNHNSSSFLRRMRRSNLKNLTQNTSSFVQASPPGAVKKMNLSKKKKNQRFQYSGSNPMEDLYSAPISSNLSVLKKNQKERNQRINDLLNDDDDDDDHVLINHSRSPINRPSMESGNKVYFKSGKKEFN